MRKILIAAALLAGLTACIDKRVDNSDFGEHYTTQFDNRTSIQVDIASAVEGELYSVYYSYPYDGETLVRQPALRALTPIFTTLDVPKDVERLYVISGGTLTEYPMANLHIRPSAPVRATRAADVNVIDAEVLAAVNSRYFPESTNNVRGDDLFKCTDLVVSETESTGAFEQAEVWLTFLGDGGSRQGQLYGKLWFYTYDSSRKESLTLGDCTFYGVKNDEIVRIDYSDIEAHRNCIFDTKTEIRNNVSSYKRFKLGTFAKGLNVGFVYYGNSRITFTTPHLNPLVTDYTLRYMDKSGTFQIRNKYVANGFVRHIQVGDFEGNVLGMENRLVTEGTKYDGDYNDMLCLIESNPLALSPDEEIGGGSESTVTEYKTREGIYLFEDNYPFVGDFDFNDVVVEYQIIDFYKSANKAKQVAVRLLALGASYTNSFGFRVGNNYTTLLENLEGYANVGTDPYRELGGVVSQTLYGDLTPYLYNGKSYIVETNFNTPFYPCVLDIPLSDPDDESWKFAWPQEMTSLDDCYYFLKGPQGGDRAKDWYRTPKEGAQVFQR